jgi:hypothetical protein
MKSGDAIWVTTLIRFKREGYQPDRDLILALTADEEGGQSNGVAWLLKNHRDLVDAEFVLNADGGGVDTATPTNRFASEESTPSRTKRRTLVAYWLFHWGSIGSGTSAGQPGTALPGSCIL